MLPEQIQQLLCTSHRKGRNQDVAFGFSGLCQHRLQFGLGRCAGTVQTVTVGAFHDDHIGVRHHGRIAQNRRTGVAQIAAENQFAVLPFIFQPYFNNGRAENMAGILQTHTDTRRNTGAMAVCQTLEIGQAGCRIVLVI